MAYKVYVDGQEGTTGLKIHEYLSLRTDLEILHIPPELRKEQEMRRQFINEADLVFLCLPDQAAREAVALIANNRTRVIDASTAHRTLWTYGFPEMNKTQRARIAESQPGFRARLPCHGVYVYCLSAGAEWPAGYERLRYLSVDYRLQRRR